MFLIYNSYCLTIMIKYVIGYSCNKVVIIASTIHSQFYKFISFEKARFFYLRNT